jgi:CRISPR-associated protein Csm1
MDVKKITNLYPIIHPKSSHATAAMNLSNRIALQMTQQAIAQLIHWTGDEIPKACSLDTIRDDSVIARASALSGWDVKQVITPLKLIFDEINLTQSQQICHYHPIGAISSSSPTIPYPLIADSSQTPSEQQADALKRLKTQIQKEVLPILESNWENLPLLTLILEKYASSLSYQDTNVAVIDQVRITITIAAALGIQAKGEQLSLVAGNLSGIQNFIYTISSEGALKSLRARSFYLELVTEEIVQQILSKLKLSRSNVIYAGGGNLYILAPEEGTELAIEELRNELNTWLLRQFQGKIFLALGSHAFPAEAISKPDFSQYWDQAIRQLNQQKLTKFSTHLSDFLNPKESYEACRVCHRDDVKDLKEFKLGSTIQACATCRSMFELGGNLLRVEAIVRSSDKTLSSNPLRFNFSDSEQVYYHFFQDWKQVLQKPDTVLLVNDWDLDHYQFKHFRNAMPLLLGNYGKSTELENETGFMSMQELADKSQGIQRVGYLRMDVDRLGQIFARGLGDNYSLSKLAGLSRQMSYFFKVYLNSLASNRRDNFLNHKSTMGLRSLSENDRQNLLFIYAGGDDLFVAGAWNELVEFAFDTYQAFRAYTGNHPDITLSGGISLVGDKFPLYQAASTSGDAEAAAKGNDRDSLGLFGEVFKWGSWIGSDRPEPKSADYLKDEAIPELYGVFPLVQAMLKLQENPNYSRSFVRNLLVVADLRDEKVREAERKYPNQVKDVSHFLHLPKLAYTLARLPKQIRGHTDFEPIRQSLMSPHNAPYFRAIATWLEFLNRKS